MADKPQLWAVVPVKNLHAAKQRLSPVLSPDERQTLFRAMLEDVLQTLLAARGLAGVMIVSRDPAALALARSLGVRVLSEPANRGHTAAVATAAAQLTAEGAAGMLTVPGDVPLATRAEIEQIVATHQAAPALTLVPARDELGSNAVACSPPDVMRLRFGDNSFYPHLERARANDLRLKVLPLPGLGLDIDTPQDLQVLLARLNGGRAARYLTRSGIAERLASTGFSC